MTTPTIETVSFEPGQLVLASTPRCLVLVDDQHAPEPETSLLLEVVGSGDIGKLRMMLVDAGLHQTFSSLAAAMWDNDEWIVVLWGTIRATVRTATASVTIDARPNEFDQRRIGDVEHISFYPNAEVALPAGEGTALLAGAVLASRASMTASGAISAVVPIIASDTPDAVVEASAAPQPTTRFRFDPHTGEPLGDGAAAAAPSPALAGPPGPPPPVPADLAEVAPVGAQTPAPTSTSSPQVVARLDELPGEPSPRRPAASPSTPPLAAPVPPVGADVGGERVQGDGVQLVDLSEPVAPREALEVGAQRHERGEREPVEVLGVRCPVDHHNHPNAVYCAQCGRRMGVNHTAVALPGPRPPLGLLLLDDGTTFSLVNDVIIGRDPDVHSDVVDHDADSLRVSDESSVLSRAHVGIYLQDWDVTAVDLGSANGTALRRDGTSDWVQLATDARTLLNAGDTLRFGDREMRLEIHHVQT